MPEPEGPPVEPETDPLEAAPEDADDANGNLWDAFTTFHYEHPVYFWLSLTAFVVGALGIGAMIWPEIIVDEFLWRHFWGPTAADANQAGIATRNGIQVTEDYTLTSEIVYGVILAGALVSLYTHLFKKRGIAVDDRFIAALLPYIFFGPLWRSMEDASVFCEIGTQTLGRCDPGLFAWPFISPLIYFLTAAFVITHLLLANATKERSAKEQLQVVGGYLGLQTLAYLGIFVAFREQFTVMVGPAVFAGLAVLSLAIYYLARERGGNHLHWSLASWGLPMTLTAAVLIWEWETGGLWVESFRAGVWEIFPVVFGLTALVVGAMALLGYIMRNDAPAFASFLTALNLGLIAGHMIDAFATFTAICSNTANELCSGAAFLGLGTSGYGEKHPVSEFFLGFADGWGFVLMKLLLVTLIIVLIDRSAREGDEDPDLIGLVKLAVLVLGLAPGLRDVVRVGMGV